MDIRTKLIFALVAVALGSMAVLGVIVSPRVEGYLRNGTLDQLDQVAESKGAALGWMIAGWRDRANLVASRTQLREGVSAYARTGGATAADRVRATLTDAIEGSLSVTVLGVYDLSGRLIAGVSRDGANAPISDSTGIEPLSGDRTRYAGVEFRRSGPPRVTFVSPVATGGRPVAALVSVFDASELLELTGDYYGLGETGETLVIARDADGLPRTLHPTRHDPDAGGGVVLSGEAGGELAARALDSERALLGDAIEDYRGQPVWAATRRVPETGWGLVVKVDRAEEYLPVAEFRAWLRKTALILAAFAILLGFVLGLRFALPIHELAGVANRIREGDMKARARVAREDEVGQLARTFNQMADELEGQMALLHEFHKFFEVSIDLMCIAGTDGYFKRINPAFTETLGWSEEELLARPFYTLIHPDDVTKTQQEVAKLAEGIPTISFENRFVCKDGSYRRLRWTSYPEDGALYAIAHVVDRTSAPDRE